MRILDLGCGPGRDLLSWGVTDSDEVTGLDNDSASLELARLRFPSRTYFLGCGEAMPFPDASFDRVISGVALPYMNIPKALGEIHRVLVPGGTFSASLHAVSFTVAELRHKAFPHPIPTLFRIYVLGNGVWFHCTGRTIGFVKGRTESFQTERGARVAFTREHFADLSFRRASGPAGETLTVEARRAAKA
jgi:ubiquinone/menaquinone biosynthesis C-methylase UbiE